MLTGSGGAAGTSLGCSGEATDARGGYLTAAVPSIGANNGGASFVFVDMPSVMSQLSMLALHKVGARLDMQACNECGFPHISSLDAHNITRIQLLQRRCRLVVVRLLSLLPAR